MRPSAIHTGRPTSGRPARLPPISLLLAAVLIWTTAGCATPSNRYHLVEESLRAGDPMRGAQVLEAAAHEYGSESQVQYRMDRGMLLHLAGQYEASNALLEQADDEIEKLYTRRVRTEATAFLTNDSKLPYEGDPYEQTLLNVVKALNYAALGKWNDALVEARRLDHRLNVLRDRTTDKEAYRDDAFGRYFSGVLYEASGDMNNAYIAYRHAYEDYRDTASWARTPLPPQLRMDLLRLSDALHFADEHEEYKKQFGEITWRPQSELQPLGQIVVIAYNGRAPRKEDFFVDVPISMEALQLVLFTKVAGHNTPNTREKRAVESTLYGLNGRVVRVALPSLVPQKSQVAYEDLQWTGPTGAFAAKTELADNITAMADKSLASRIKGITVKAVARAITKFGLAEGVGRGAQAAAGHDAGPLVGLVVGGLAKAIAVASEEADKRLWQTLPDEIQLGWMWLPAGDYEMKIQPVGRDGRLLGPPVKRIMHVEAGRTQFVIHRSVQ